eukprot:gene17136-biopygen814
MRSLQDTVAASLQGGWRWPQECHAGSRAAGSYPRVHTSFEYDSELPFVPWLASAGRAARARCGVSAVRLERHAGQASMMVRWYDGGMMVRWYDGMTA